MEEQNFEDSRRVKQEPPVEFVLILPRPTFGWREIKQEKDVKPKRVPTVKLAKFDATWRSKPEMFQTLLVCPHCQLVIRSHINLTRHLSACSKINPARFECDFCRERYRKKWQIRQHMLKHSSERKFCCTTCGFGFKTKNELLKHSRIKKIYKCAACEVEFPCKLLLDRHRSESHGNIFKCDQCSYQTRIKGRFMNHKGTHDKSIACETCQKKFSKGQNLKLHQMQHRHGIYATAPEETFGCDKCGKLFSTPNHLKVHRRVVHEKNEVKCEVCGKIFKNRHLLRQHSQIHNKVECSICHKMFSKDKMAYHVRTHSAENHFRCDLCDHSTKTKGILKEHIERMHLLKKLVNDSKHREDFIEFKLLEKLQLRHRSSATTSEKKFECDKCNKSFKFLNRLNWHKKTVHTIKLFECEFCKKVFKAKSYLKCHRARVHSKKK